MRSTVDQLSWIERFYPSNVAKGMAGGLDTVSDWLKASNKKHSSSPTQSERSKDTAYSSAQRYILYSKFLCLTVHHNTKLSHLGSGVSNSKDRLLTSEIAELQGRVQALLKENHELRKELVKVSGMDPSRIRSGRKVCG